MKNYELIMSAEINSLHEVKKNYMIDMDTLEKICSCSIAISLNDLSSTEKDNIINASSDLEMTVSAIEIGSGLNIFIEAYPTKIDIDSRIPTRELLRSIRTISKFR